MWFSLLWTLPIMNRFFDYLRVHNSEIRQYLWFDEAMAAVSDEEDIRQCWLIKDRWLFNGYTWKLILAISKNALKSNFGELSEIKFNGHF